MSNDLEIALAWQNNYCSWLEHPLCYNELTGEWRYNGEIIGKDSQIVVDFLHKNKKMTPLDYTLFLKH